MTKNAVEAKQYILRVPGQPDQKITDQALIQKLPDWMRSSGEDPSLTTSRTTL